jgi:hypothetical protein
MNNRFISMVGRKFLHTRGQRILLSKNFSHLAAGTQVNIQQSTLSKTVTLNLSLPFIYVGKEDAGVVPGHK